MGKQHGKLFNSNFLLLLSYSCLVCGVLMVGVFMGSMATSYSYGQAFKDGDIHVCTPQEIDTQQLINEYNKCLAKKDFVNNLSGSFTNIYKSPTK